ncbi:MAG: NAD(P)/FAD-dependent oxidoreductase [Rhodocyclaceae bacterium]|nr:NAD(P)/FAD-dependent oxidoreductase [Rhodocyclaceae bacterium]MBX3669763.1 NAD(P)/FAD-dependent oxidoreductase [Rhodocyclaceae bacterium]
MNLDFDAIVIGAGAAGLFCAGTAGARGRRVLLLDASARLAEKIRISGGGRCNFTNIHCTHHNFLSRQPEFCRQALARFSARDFIALVDKHGIAWHEKTLGQLFCDDSSQRIIDMLDRNAARAGVKRLMQCAIAAVAKDGDQFRIESTQGNFRAAKLVVASGGLSIPQIGASPFGYRLAEQFGLEVVAPRPGLVPLSMDPAWLARYGDLSGLSFPAEVHAPGAKFREQVLITHRGLSGPAILQASSYWQWQEGTKRPLEIDLMPEIDAHAWLRQLRAGGSRAGLAGALAQHLPRRLAQQLADGTPGAGRVAEMSNRTIDEVATSLQRWSIQPAGTLGYRKAEVTLGGVATEELDPVSLEARRVPGLHFIGEVVDVTGHLGGHNFQWAWSSGWCAGMAL